MDSASCCSGLFCYRGPRPGWFDPGSCQAITDGVDWVVRAHDDASGAHDALLPRATLFNGAFASANSHLMDYAGLGRLQMLVAPAPETEATHLSAGTYEASSPAGMTFPISPTNIPHTRDGRLVYLDMNGDGLRDVLDLSGGAAAQIRLNSGRGLVEATPAYLPGVAPVDVYSGRTTGDVRVADFNQDGREDFLLLYEGDPMVPGDSVFMLHYATDAGFVRHRVDVLDAEPIYIPEFAGVPAFRSWNTVQLGDIDGDSEIDIVASNYDRLTSLTSLDERPDLLSDIRYGQPLDAAGEPRFEPLSAVRVHYARVNGGHAIRSLPAGQPSRVLYHAPSSCEFPQRCLRKGLTVVERHSELTATGDLLSDPDDEVQREQLYAHFEYTYRDGVVDTQGQGFLGFAQREVVQWDALPEAPFRRDWARTEWTFDLTTRAADGLTAFAGTPVALERHVLNLIDGRYHAQRLETELEHESPTGLNSHDGPPIIFRRPAGTRFFDYDLPEAPAELAGNPDFYLRTVTSIRYDDWSIPTRWRVSTEGGRQETMTATPARDVSTNLLARYGSIETSSLAPGFPRAAMRVDYEYDPSTQLVERMVANADDPQRIRITEFGRRASTGVVEVMNEYTWDPDSAPGAPPVLSRTGEVSYDTEQLYPTSIGVETGTTLLTSRLLVHPGLGVLQRMVGPNGATTEFRHDGFGRLREVRRVGADVIEYDHLPPTNPFDQFIVDVEASDGHHTQLTLDAFSRVRQRRELSEQPGVWWTSSSTFDARGQLARQTLPHTEGEAAPAHTMVRDDLGRVTTWRDPAGGETRVAYGSVGDGGAYDPRRMQVTTPRDNTYARYLDANGQTHRFVDPAGEEATYWYGPFGRIQHVDLPQDTFRTYEYDSNGLLDAVEDSRIGVEQYERDGFGEIFEIARPDGARVTLRRDGVGRVTRRVSDDGTAFFIYDVGPTGAGFLGTSVGEDGTSEIYSYDTEGRLSGITRGVVGASISQDYTYDPSTGRLESTRVTGPPGGLAGGAGVEFDYSNGHLTGVNSPELGRGIWRSLSLHPQGFVASEQYPETGLEVERDLDPTDRQLSWRSDVQDLEVTLDADGNVSSIVDGFDPAAGVQDFEYDDRGRLDLWSWAGTSFETDYAYDALGNVLENETGELTYDPGTTLLSGIEGMPVTHDPRGRVDSALGRAITWRDSDLFDEVQEMGTGQNVRFSYSANHARAAWQSSTGASALNLGGYRRYQDADGVRETFSVPGPTRTVAELVSVDGGALALRHVHDDHLGSTAVVSSATEEPTRFWRSPFGRLVDPADGEFLDGSTGIADLDPRFTTHRADGQTPSLGTTGAGFIHMRGREYDPALGQMLSPDPATPISSDVDGWNPYSYVVNNPSTLVDPSGYNPFDILVTGTNVIIDTGSATVTASDFLDFAQTIYNSHANPPFRDAQGDPRAAAYELFGFANGLGAWFFEFEPRRSIEDTARYEFFFTRGQAWGSAVGALGDMVMIGAGVAMMSGGEWLPFIGGGAGGEGAAVGTILGIKMWVAGAGLAAVGGAALSGYHGPRFNESIERLDRFYNERQPSGSSRPPAASAGRRAPSIRGRLRAAGTHGLPGGRQASGPFRYRPPEGYNPSDPLPRNGRNGGFIDRFGNEWQQGPYHGDPDLPFSHEWDVQLSARGRRWYERANPGHRAPDYINVRPDGYLSH